MAAVTAVQWLPSRELERLSVASQRARWATPDSGMALQALVSLVWPDRLGVFEFPGNNWSLPWNPTFLYLYCGIPALLLAALALALAREWRRETAVFAAVTAAFALWMLGGSTPIGHALMPRLPDGLRGAVYPEFGMAAFSAGRGRAGGLRRGSSTGRARPMDSRGPAGGDRGGPHSSLVPAAT